MMTKVKAHLVDIDWPVKLAVENPCVEIELPKLMEPYQITLLQLKGIAVFDYTESLNMDEEWVDKERCYVP
jgi:hypothetical protein